MKIVTFSGLDGSGKTTQATRFVSRRVEEGRDAIYEHQFRFNSERVMQAKGRLRPFLLFVQAAVCEEGTVVLAPNADDSLHRGIIRHTVQKVFLIPILTAIVLVLGWYRTRKKLRSNAEHEILVLDRYFYDEIVRVEWKFGIRLPFRKMLLKTLPRPHLVIYFDIPGDISWQRMDPQDSSKNAMLRKEIAFKRLLPLIGEDTTLRIISIIGLTADEVQNQVEKIFQVASGCH